MATVDSFGPLVSAFLYFREMEEEMQELSQESLADRIWNVASQLWTNPGTQAMASEEGGGGMKPAALWDSEGSLGLASGAALCTYGVMRRLLQSPGSDRVFLVTGAALVFTSLPLLMRRERASSGPYA